MQFSIAAYKHLTQNAHTYICSFGSDLFTDNSNIRKYYVKSQWREQDGLSVPHNTEQAAMQWTCVAEVHGWSRKRYTTQDSSVKRQIVDALPTMSSVHQQEALPAQMCYGMATPQPANWPGCGILTHFDHQTTQLPLYLCRENIAPGTMHSNRASCMSQHALTPIAYHITLRSDQHAEYSLQHFNWLYTKIQMF